MLFGMNGRVTFPHLGNVLTRDSRVSPKAILVVVVGGVSTMEKSKSKGILED